MTSGTFLDLYIWCSSWSNSRPLALACFLEIMFFIACPLRQTSNYAYSLPLSWELVETISLLIGSYNEFQGGNESWAIMAKYQSRNFEISPENLGHLVVVSFLELLRIVDSLENVSFNIWSICDWKTSLLTGVGYTGWDVLATWRTGRGIATVVVRLVTVDCDPATLVIFCTGDEL